MVNAFWVHEYPTTQLLNLISLLLDHTLILLCFDVVERFDKLKEEITTLLVKENNFWRQRPKVF